MTASSTDAYSSSSTKLNEEIPLFTNYPVVSVTTDHSSFWPTDPSSNSTSPSSEHNWEIDEEEVIKRRIYELKRQFHNGRYLIVKHLPRDATEEDVRDLLKGHFVHSVQLQTTNGTAKVLLAEPEVLETWPKNTQHTLKGNKVVICPANSEGLLCIAKLPLDYAEDDFAVLLSNLGDVNFCFLMRSEKSGETKSYGFVEYANKEIAMQAKCALDGRELRDTILVCDWLDPSHVTFVSLHSKCLFVDKLPKDYRDMGEFRRIFSKIKNPIYCQIAMKQGALQDWGLVEFDSGEDAEETRNSLNNFKVRGQPIRVEYYVPGVRAVNIYMKMLNDQEQKRKAALLPEPPTNKVFVQLKNLTKHNPAFAKSLQNIILTQIQSLQERSRSNTPVENIGRPESTPPTNSLVRVPRSIPDIPPALVNFMHLPPMSRIHNSIEQPLNGNAQAALVILLAAQLQQQQGVNNILSNPQVLKLLQTLVSQGDPKQSNCTSIPSSSSGPSLSSSLKANFRNGYFKSGGNKLLKGPLLPTPDIGSQWRPELEIERSVGPILDGILETPKDHISTNLTESISTLLSNAQNLQQLLGTLGTESSALTSVPPHIPGLHLPPIVSAPSVCAPPNTAILCPPPALYDPTQAQNPLLSMLMQTPESVHSETFLGPLTSVAAQTSYLLANTPVSTRNAPTTTWAPAISPQPIFHHSAPLFSAAPPTALQPRLYSPIYIPTGALGQHGIMAPSVHPPVGTAHYSLNGFNTPVGQKRKSHFLPSPEPSPENGYIGQHSQGIGGHYPDSYARKKKKH